MAALHVAASVYVSGFPLLYSIQYLRYTVSGRNIYFPLIYLFQIKIIQFIFNIQKSTPGDTIYLLLFHHLPVQISLLEVK